MRICMEWLIERSKLNDVPLFKQVFDLQGPILVSHLVPLNSGSHVQWYPKGNLGSLVQLPECSHSFNASQGVIEILQELSM